MSKPKCTRDSSGLHLHHGPCEHKQMDLSPIVYYGKQPAKMEGLKFDTDKPPLSIIPLTALEQEALVFKFGAAKYGKDNYKLGMDWTRLIDAALRHITSFNEGDDLDPESGQSHLAHARCCLAMLLFYSKNKKGNDDRYKPSSDASMNNSNSDEVLRDRKV